MFSGAGCSTKGAGATESVVVESAPADGKTMPGGTSCAKTTLAKRNRETRIRFIGQLSDILQKIKGFASQFHATVAGDNLVRADFAALGKVLRPALEKVLDGIGMVGLHHLCGI